MGKAKSKILEWPQKHYGIPGGTAEVSAAIKDLKVRVRESYCISISLAYLACAEDRWILGPNSGSSYTQSVGDFDCSCLSRYVHFSHPLASGMQLLSLQMPLPLCTC